MSRVCAKSTRASTECPMFGMGEDLWHRNLPTYEGVFKYYLFVRNDLKQNTNKDPSISQILEQVVDKLKTIWESASVPILSDRRIETMFRSYHEKYRVIMKPYQSRKNSEAYKAKIDMFKKEAHTKLFDIAACKCKVLTQCSCPKEKTVPKEEVTFLLDQRSERKLFIDRVDITHTKKKASTLLRKQKEAVRLTKESSQEKLQDTNVELSSSTSNSESESGEISDDTFPEPVSSKRKLEQPEEQLFKKRKTTNLPSVATACDRTAVSDQAAAFIVSAVLQDIGEVSIDNTSEVVEYSVTKFRLN